MDKPAWKKRITESCEQAGTYREWFDGVIDTLAGILERRDEANELFISTGGNVIVTHTNKAGAKNIEQNPILRLVNDLNRDALAYWRDLGLTPAGYRKLNADIIQEKGAGEGLEQILARITE
jgi:phage terminase small subunit